MRNFQNGKKINTKITQKSKSKKNPKIKNPQKSQTKAKASDRI